MERAHKVSEFFSVPANTSYKLVEKQIVFRAAAIVVVVVARDYRVPPQSGLKQGALRQACFDWTPA